MEVYQTFVVLSVCIWSLYCTNVSKTSETGNTQTVCAGKETSFICEIVDPSKVHMITFVKDENILGYYFSKTDTYVYPEFRGRYSIIKDNSVIILTIKESKELDEGKFSCSITYDGKEDVKVEQHIIIKEREKSNIILFKKEKSDFCTILNCSANGRLLKLKKPDNAEITEKNIVLNTCKSSLRNGQYSCCLMDNCSQGECKNLTLEVAGENLVHYWIIPVIIESLVLMIIIVVAVRCILKMRDNNNQQMKLTDEDHQSILNQINLSLEEQMTLLNYTTLEEQQPLHMQKNLPQNQTNLSHEEEKSLPASITQNDKLNMFLLNKMIQADQESLAKKMNLLYEEQRSLPNLERLRSRPDFEETLPLLAELKEKLSTKNGKGAITSTSLSSGMYRRLTPIPLRRRQRHTIV